MSFDEEVDAARRKLEEAMAEAEAEPGFDAARALSSLLPILRTRLQSRRLAFALSDDEEEPLIEVVHVETDEVLGEIFAEDGEFGFESALGDYFDDFVDPEPESFVLRLYETLRADLPKYEVEQRD